MNWISIIVSAFGGAIAALITSVLVRDRQENKRQFAGVFVVMLLVMLAISREFITPQIQAYFAVRSVDSKLSVNPTFAALKKYDPKTYSNILAELKKSISHGQTETEAILSIRNNIEAIVQKRLPIASNESAAAYMQIMVQEMKELDKHGSDTCYKFLFPQAGQAIELNKFIPENIKQADVAALGDVIKTSATSPQSVPKEAEISSFMQPVIEELARNYGQEMAVLQAPTAPGANKAKVCQMTIVLYDRILQLPSDQAGLIIRYLIGHI